MKIKDLISALQRFPENADIVILNVGGYGKGITFGPLEKNLRFIHGLTFYEENNQLMLKPGFGDKKLEIAVVKRRQNKKI